ncbi:MAG TPA: pitrilysin family protein [Ktedonobacterales bacterium]|nr:pitrilysin family protein [Ktedonobacterales bacterium]
MHEKTTLRNGVRIVTAEMPHVRSVSTALFFGVGSRFESSEEAGISHFIEHMLFKGAEHYPTAQAISEAIEGIGGVFNGGTGKELTGYTAKVSSDHFVDALDVLVNMVRHPLFDPQELEKERRVITEELNMYKDSPQEWVQVLIDETVWPDLPLGRDEAGTKESVERMTRSQMRDYLAAHYLPNNLVVSVAGKVTHQQVVDEVERRLSDWEPRELPRFEPCLPPREVPRVRLEYKRTEQANICLALPGVSHDDPARYPLAMLNGVLADGMSSRLFQEIRERQGLAYDVNSDVESFYETGALVIYAGVDPERTEATLRAILAELARLREEPVPDAELHRIKEYTKGRMVLRLEETHQVASGLGGEEILRNRITDIDEAMALVDAVTAEEMQQLAQRLFQEADLRLAVVGPLKDAKHFDRLLHF